VKNFDYAIETLRAEREKEMKRNWLLSGSPVEEGTYARIDELDRAIALLTDVAAARVPA
jgi:hypothetical protein